MSNTRPLEVRNSIWRYGVPGLLSLVLSAGIGWLMLAENQPFDWRMWLGVLLFGAAGLWYLWRTFDRRPVVAINATGIEVRAKWIGSVPWQDVLSVELRNTGSASQLLIYPKDVDTWQKRLPLLTKLAWKLFPRWRCLSVLLLNVNCSNAKIASALAAFSTAKSESTDSPSISASHPY